MYGLQRVVVKNFYIKLVIIDGIINVRFVFVKIIHLLNLVKLISHKIFFYYIIRLIKNADFRENINWKNNYY